MVPTKPWFNRGYIATLLQENVLHLVFENALFFHPACPSLDSAKHQSRDSQLNIIIPPHIKSLMHLSHWYKATQDKVPGLANSNG